MGKHFFMVYLEGERTPSFKHDTIEQAETEAKRLSERYGKVAYVLCAIKSVSKVIWDVQNLLPHSDDDLPF